MNELVDKRIKGRYYSLQQRCCNSKRQEFKYYGALGIQLKMSLQDLFSFFKAEALKRDVDLENERQGLEFLEMYQIDRFNRSKDFTLKNIRLVLKEHHQKAQKRALAHIRLSKDLWCVLSLIDSLLGLPKTTMRKRIEERRLRGSKKPLLGIHQGLINLWWYQVDKPPLEIVNRQGEDFVLCKCGKFHRVEIGADNCIFMKPNIKKEQLKYQVSTYENLQNCEDFLFDYVKY